MSLSLLEGILLYASYIATIIVAVIAVGSLVRRYSAKLRRALETRYQAIAIRPRDASTWNRKGEALRSLGRYKKAIAYYDRALQIDQSYIFAWDNKGEALRSLGRYEDADICYDNALAIDQHDARAWNGKGEIRRIRHDGEAINCYDKAITSNPRFAYAWDNKGKCLLTLGRHDEAENCFKKAEVLRTKT